VKRKRLGSGCDSRGSNSLTVSLVGRIVPLACAFAIAGIAVGNAQPTGASVPADTLYASFGGLITIDQSDGSTTRLGPLIAFVGVAFDSDGRLFTTGCVFSPPTFCDSLIDNELMELDPVTGAILDTIGPVTDASGSPVPITALSVQPGTDVLYGFAERGSSRFRPGSIWTIDKSTAAATLVASEVPAGCVQPACSRVAENGLAFAPDGTLYHVAQQAFNLPKMLMTLDPSTGALIASVPLDGFGNSPAPLAVRSDGTIFSHSFTFLRLPPPVRRVRRRQPSFSVLS